MEKDLIAFLLKQQAQEKMDERHQKLNRVLLLLASVAGLAIALAMPETVRLLRYFRPDKSDWDEWKMFNKRYLQNTIRRLQKLKIIEAEEKDGYQTVKITEKGKSRILKYAIESLKIAQPPKWDRKWRLVFYDIFDQKKITRDRFRRILKGAGFYPLQKSVYLHAYPCEPQLEFLRTFLGISGEVRLVVADEIENDELFRKYFGIAS